MISKFLAVSLLLLSACATSEERVILTTCPSDPFSKSLRCIRPSGDTINIPWERSEGYMCFPKDDAVTILERFMK